MKKIFVLIVFLILCFISEAQNVDDAKKWEERYFKYSSSSLLLSGWPYVSVKPLFASSPEQQSNMIRAGVALLNKDSKDMDWTEFTTMFIERALKKHLSVDEIRKLWDNETKRAKAQVLFFFNYSGDILYAFFIFKGEFRSFLDDEKLYGIYQDFVNLKVDTGGFLWWTESGRPTLEEQKKVYGFMSLPFFFERNCP